MKILLLGASGRTGKHVLSYLITENYHVHCLLRDSSRIEQHNRITLFEGNSTVLSDLKKAIEGRDVVISTLNISRTSDFPWAHIRTPKNFLSEVMSNLCELEPAKIITCSAWGVGDSRKDIPFWFRWFIDNSNIGIAYKDHELQEAILMKSGLKSQIVRPVGLTNGKLNRQVKASVNNHPKPNLLISRRSLAYFLVKLIKEDAYIGKPVVLST